MTSAKNIPARAALVTGSAIRLGRAIALGLAQQGIDIALHYHTSGEAAEQTAADIRAWGVKCVLFKRDLSQDETFAGLMRQVRDTFPHLNLLVNSASGYAQAPIMATDVATFDAQMALNLRAPFFLTQSFAKQIKAGNVINILDNKIGFNQYHYAAYLLTKKALTEFTKMAALELAPNIRVNGVAPGVTLPNESRTSDYLEWRIQAIPLKRQGKADHINQTISYILNNEFVTGQIFVVDGGEALTNVGLNAGSYSERNDE